MTKNIFLFTLVLLSSSSIIYSQKFLGEDKFDIFQCMSDIGNLNAELHRILDSNAPIQTLIQELAALKPMLGSTLTDCGILNVSGENILLTENERIPISIDLLPCLSDLKTISTLLSAVLADVAAYNVNNALQDLTKMRAAVAALTNDCPNVNTTKDSALKDSNNSWFGGSWECFTDISEHLVPDLEAFLNAAKSGQIQDIIAALNLVVVDINAVVADCGLSYFEEVQVALQHLNTISPINCLSDINEVVNLAGTIIQNFNNSQYEELISNLLQFVNEAQQAITDCTGSNTTFTEAKDLIKANVQNIECAGRFNEIARELRNVISAPRSEVLLRTQNTFKIFEELVKTCGDQDYPILKRIVKIDVFACMQDIENLVAIATRTLSDAESYNLEALISDVEQLVSVAETAEADCTGSNATTTQKLSMDVFKCINDVEEEVEQIKDLMQGISAGNITDLFPRIISIVNGLDLLLEDCGMNSSIEAMAKEVIINPEDCMSDVNDVINVVDQVIVDYQTQNWSQLAVDVLYAVDKVQHLAADCFNYNLTSYISDSCVADMENLVQNLSAVVDRISNSNETYEDILEIGQMIYNVVKEVGTLETDCGLNFDFILNNKESLDSLLVGNVCMESIKDLVDVVSDIMSETSIITKIEKIIANKKNIENIRANCFGMNDLKSQDEIVSYVQTKALIL